MSEQRRNLCHKRSLSKLVVHRYVRMSIPSLCGCRGMNLNPNPNLNRDSTPEIMMVVELAPFSKGNSRCSTIKTDVIGTLNMLGLAKHVGARILLTLTCEACASPN
ncbi:hypothetical protein C5167_042152 [Papaver somniferum]|nr:hypothetical protein C5167_042152 [Papaver somniferum]